MRIGLNTRARRLTVVSIALLLAMAAGATAWIFMSGLQRRAYHDAALTIVYVVAKPIPDGTSASAIVGNGLVKRSTVPVQYRPADAVTNLSTIAGETTIANLTTGEVLAAGLFSAQAPVSGPVAAIPSGDVAITVSVDPVHGVAGLVSPGDLVDVLVTIENQTERFLYQNVQVLAVDSALAGSSTSEQTVSDPPPASSTPSANALITFAVPPAAAQRIALAASDGGGVTGSLYLALVRPGNQPSSSGAVASNNLIPATLSPR